MHLMAIWNGLGRTISHIGKLWGAVVPNQADDHHDGQEATNS